MIQLYETLLPPAPACVVVPTPALPLSDPYKRGSLAFTRSMSVRSTALRCPVVIGFLLAFSRRNARHGQDPASFELPMTRTDIGDFLGLTIETVSRTFTKLKLRGLIELPHCNQVTLLDIDELNSLADGEEQDA